MEIKEKHEKKGRKQNKLWINNSGQMRSGWKVLLVSIIAVIFVIGLSMLMEFLGIRDKFGISVFLGFIISVLIMLKFVDKKDLRYVGLGRFKYGFSELIMGLLVGAFFIILNVLILQISGLAVFRTDIFSPQFGVSLIEGFFLFILVGFAEELLFRAYIIESFQQMGKSWLSVLLSGLIFALLHGGLNDNISFLAVLNLLGGGILMGYMYLSTRSLYLPIGFHIGWNYFQGYIFGVEVSGREMGNALYILDLKDHIMCGGKFGMEGGLGNTIVIVLAFAFVYLFKLRMKRIAEFYKGE